jgi:cation diffusion facilitator CzcD-associated flavoprotein CzcO
MPSAVQAAASSIVSARSVDDARPLKIVIIGAGICGILAAIKIQQRLSNYELVIYDKNEEVGGTWYENRYPGVACGTSIHSGGHD